MVATSSASPADRLNRLAMWATLVSRDEVPATSSEVPATSRRSTLASLAWLADNPA